MCGITGAIHFDGAPMERALLERMGSVIAHRGPDGSGEWVDRNVGLGHRRLSIIDLSDAGQQPMFTADGRYVLVYNGEVYNYRELRHELKQEGIQFRSRTDSEVVLQALATWGVAKAVRRFNGMFAFALWDKQRRSLYLVRDRYGIKPLYYYNDGACFVFGSEIKAILQHPGVRSTMDKEGLVEYLTFQNFLTSRTLFNNVSLLPPGTIAELPVPDQIGRSTSLTMDEYWDFNFEEPSEPLRESEYLEELDSLFVNAVKRQLVSDVDVGAYLSGGMDSGSITAVAAEDSAFMRTFTCGFDLRSASGIEMSFDERSTAEYMSYLFKTEHYEMVLKSGDMERVMPKLAYALEEPRVGQSYPNYYVAGLASKFNKVVLAGTGGDEIFGGYPWRYYRAVVNTSFDDYTDKYFGFWQRLLREENLRSVLSPIWSEVSHVSTREIFRSVFKHHSDAMQTPEDYVNHSLYFETKTFLHGLLMVEDKLSMAHSLETRVPFLDNDLVDFALKIPTSMKLGNLNEVVQLNENTPGAKTARYFQKTNDGKLLLRKMMSRILPSEIVDREKQGFSAPDASWFKGESIDYVRSTLLDQNAKIYNFLDYKGTTRLLETHLSGKENRRLLIWSLLNLEELMNRFYLGA